MKKYKVAYATSSRADYGIVKNYLKYLNEDSYIEFSLLVTGTHLEEKFGKTIDNILADKFKVDFSIKIDINEKSNEGITKSMSTCLEKFGEYFQNNRYDLLIVLGDRYEILTIAIAAAINGIPILHLHGGECTFGNYDEFIRHSITKMSRFHITSTNEYRNRVIQLGENPDNVFYLGALGAENCKNIDINKVDNKVVELEKEKYFVVVFHPETLGKLNISEQVDEIIEAINKVDKKYRFIFIGSNADTNSNIIRDKWSKYVHDNDNACYFENVNVDSYLYLVKNSIALIGNTSSGIIEAPSLNTYTINIGNRQNGRVHAKSVLDVKCESDEILKSIEKILGGINQKEDFVNPYYKENTSRSYYEKTKEILLRDVSKPKEFYDIE